MRTATVEFEGIAPYSQSRAHFTEKKDDGKEKAEAYEERTWVERLHYNDAGEVYIPPMAFKNALSAAGKYLKEGVKGEGKATYTKYLESGVLVVDPVFIGVNKKNIQSEKLFVPSDGMRGGGKRVLKFFPIIHKWSGVVTFHIMESKINDDVFERHINAVGNFIGLGRFRPQNNGFYGRFKVKKINWS